MFLFHLNKEGKGELLVPTDKKRSYSPDERLIVWLTANKQCAICNEEILLEKMHADHIQPFAKGGLTTLSNAQCLCAPCNLKKSDN